MNKHLKVLAQFLKRIDFFRTNQLFRYKSKQKYQSLFGGMISIILVIFLGLLFYLKFAQSLDRSRISSSGQKQNSVNPTLLQISTYPDQKFMMALGIPGINFNDPQMRYFDITFQNYWNVWDLTNVEYLDFSYQILLQPCTRQHWEAFPQLEQDLSFLNVSHLLCIPLSTQLNFMGDINSDDWRNIQIFLDPCSPESDPLRRCASGDQMQVLFGNNPKIELKLYFTNVIIQPNNKKHITYFLDDRYHGTFTYEYCSTSTIYIQDYTIETDQNIFPLQGKSPLIQKGAIIQEKLFMSSSERNSSQYFAYILIQKSPFSNFYSRNFYHFTEVSAYVGGLLKVGLACFFLINTYNFVAFEINIGSKIFDSDSQEQKAFENYNFLFFIFQRFFYLISKIGISFNWKRVIRYNQCERELKKQLDSLYFLQRIWYLEEAVSIVMENHHIKGLRLKQRLTLEEAKERRESANLGAQIKKIKDQEILKIKEANMENPNQNTDLSEPPRITEQRKMLEEMKKVKQEASNGHHVSQRIMEIAFSKIVGLMEYQKESENNGDQNKMSDKAKIENEFFDNKNENIIEPLEDEKDRMLPSAFQKAQYSLSRVLTNAIKKFDIFSASEYFRFKSSTQHKTSFGGLMTVLMIIGAFLLGSTSISRYLAKADIRIKEEKTVSAEPELFQLNTYPKSNFMVSLLIFEDQYSNTSRQFDYYMVNRFRTFNEEKNEWTEIAKQQKLVQCSKKHIDWVSEESLQDMKDYLRSLDASKRLCLPLGKTFYVQGKQYSHNFSFLQLVGRRCSDSRDPSRPCTQQTKTQKFYYELDFELQVYVTNPIISPKSQNYIRYHLQDRIYAYFEDNQFIKTDFQLQQFTIKTYHGIFPFSSPKVQTGHLITNFPHIQRSSDNNNNSTDKEYFRVRFLRSPVTRVYIRTFEAFSQFIAFLGGLFAIFSAGFFIVNSYNHCNYQISIGSQLFKNEKSISFNLKQFNILSLLKVKFFKFLSFFGSNPKWLSTIEYIKFQDEMEKQLDLFYLIERLEFLETAFSTVLEPHQMKALHLKELPTLSEAKQKRKEVKIRNQMKKIRSKEERRKKKRLRKHQKQEKEQEKETMAMKESQLSINPASESETPQSFFKESGLILGRQLESEIAKKDLISDGVSEVSSDNSSLSDIDEEEIKVEMEYQLAIIQAKARKGERMSQKIMEIVSRTKTGTSLLEKSAVFEKKFKTEISQSQSSIVEEVESNEREDDEKKEIGKIFRHLLKQPLKMSEKPKSIKPKSTAQQRRRINKNLGP